ncbi:MAG: flagellin [Mangrovicoccus sp.]|nr:flagellin [Mangrovicoccus sp.]
MALSGLGDLAQSYAMRGHNLAVRQEMNRLITELSTSQTADIPQRLGGDFSVLSAVEASLTASAAYDIVLVEAGNFAASMQTALGAVQASMADSGPKLLAAVNPGDEQLLSASLAEAAQRFEAIMSQLNSRDGNRSLFAGNAVDRPAVASPELLLSELSNAVAGLSNHGDIRAAVDAWFDTPGGGFDAMVYLGGEDPLAPYQLSDVSYVRLELRAQDDEIRNVIKEFSIAALMDRGLLSGNLNERRALAEETGTAMLNVERDLVLARAEIGTAEAYIEEISVRNTAERMSLLEMRDNLIGVDPFESATRLEEAQTQLQMVYNITARLAGMSLAEYLR